MFFYPQTKYADQKYFCGLRFQTISSLFVFCFIRAIVLFAVNQCYFFVKGLVQ